MRHTHTSRVSSVSVHTHLNILISEIMLIYTFSLYYILYQVQVTSTGTFNQNFMQLYYLFILFCPVPPVPYGLRIALLYLLFTNLPTKQ